MARSLTPSPKTPSSRTKQLSHSISTPHLAAAASNFRSESDMLNTIPDPRSPSPAAPVARQTSSDSSRHPDLSSEVATLSTKLVNAINHQLNLDDTLQATRLELDTAKEKVRKLEEEAKKHADLVSQGYWVKREEMDKLQQECIEERKQRKFMEKEKKKMESELEGLTTALFEEANTMVSAARKETEASERRNDQLRNQLQDSEILLRSHQDQLHDLKSVMEKMSSERDENESNAHSLTAPSTPALNAHDKVSRMLDNSTGSPTSSSIEDFSPDHPLRFSHLLHPVLRTDLNTYKEFQELLRQGRIFSNPPSRVGSGNFSKINILGINALDSSITQHANASTASLAATSPSSAASSPRTSANLPPLKETTFFKRAITEDIEPTLRLDQAPGVSWMGRRTVINSIVTGSLVVEPHPPIKKNRGPVYACSLCGESRPDDQYNRNYRFKTSEADDAQRYPLCDWCMGRVRSTCDYVGFLRMVQAGHWRADNEEEMKAAWEETVRFRERMFWARIGGGVVPTVFNSKDSLKSPVVTRDGERSSEETVDTVNTVDSNTTTERDAHLRPEDPFKAEAPSKRVSIGNTIISKSGASENSTDVSDASSPSSEDYQELASEQLHKEHIKTATDMEPKDREMQDTTETSNPMPGSFE